MGIRCLKCEIASSFFDRKFDNQKVFNIDNEKLSVNEDQLKIIEKQSKKSICKIKCNNDNEKEGIGFFCKIPFKNKNNNFINVLIFHNYLIDISKSKEIYVSLNNTDFNFTITIDDSRKKYIEKNKYEIAIIELKDSDTDNLNDILFLEIDEGLEKIKYIYCLDFSNNNKNNYCPKFISISLNPDYFIFDLSKQINDLGSPLINFTNNKVIGLTQNNKKGVLIKEPIKKFFEVNDNPYIKSILLCLFKIDELGNILKKFVKRKNNNNSLYNITSLIYNCMENYKQNNFEIFFYTIKLYKWI